MAKKGLESVRIRMKVDDLVVTRKAIESHARTLRMLLGRHRRRPDDHPLALELARTVRLREKLDDALIAAFPADFVSELQADEEMRGAFVG